MTYLDAIHVKNTEFPHEVRLFTKKICFQSCLFESVASSWMDQKITVMLKSDLPFLQHKKFRFGDSDFFKVKNLSLNVGYFKSYILSSFILFFTVQRIIVSIINKKYLKLFAVVASKKTQRQKWRSKLWKRINVSRNRIKFSFVLNCKRKIMIANNKKWDLDK